MKKKNKLHLIYLLITGLTVGLIQSCNPKKSDQGELITTVILHVTNGGIPIGDYTWKDPDGDGGNAPLPADTIRLDSGNIYMVSISFKNQSGTNDIDLTEEIRNEGSAHLLCFTPTPASIQVKASDSDGKFPIGLQSEWKSTEKNVGKMRIVLRHQPGVKNGSCDPGETDADVEFPFIIK